MSRPKLVGFNGPMHPFAVNPNHVTMLTYSEVDRKGETIRIHLVGGTYHDVHLSRREHAHIKDSLAAVAEELGFDVKGRADPQADFPEDFRFED